MCNRRKKKEAEARAKMEQQMRMLQMQRMMQMQSNPYANLQYGPMSGSPNPCAAPSRFIQLTPIVQPIAMVPYSTQNQPLLMYDNRQSNMPSYLGSDDFDFDSDDDW